MQSVSKHHQHFFTELDQTILKFVWNHRRPRIAQATLKKQSKARGIIILDFKIYYKAVVIKTVWCWHKNRHLDHKNSIESLETDQHLYGQLIYDKGDKNVQWRKRQSCQQMGWEN